MPFINLTQSRENTYWPIVFLIGFVILSENMFGIGIFQHSGKSGTWQWVIKATMFLFSLITLVGVSFTWNVFVEFNFSSSFNVWSKDVYSKEI